MASKRDREKTVRQEEAAAPVPTWHGKAYGALIAAGGLMLLLSLATFRLNEIGWTALNAKAEVAASNTNFFGFFGRYLAALVYWCFGAASWMAAACLVWLGCYKIVHHGEIRLRMWIAFGCALLSACMMLSVQPWVLEVWTREHQLYGPGGALGHLFGHCFISQVMGMGGSLVLCVFAYLVSLIYVLGTTPLAAGRVLWHDFRQWWKVSRERRRARKDARAVLMREREEENARRAQEMSDLQTDTEPLPSPVRKTAVSRRARQSGGDPLDDLEKKVEEEIVAMTEPGFLPLSVTNPEPQIIDASRTRPPRPVLTLRSDDGVAADAGMEAYALPSLEILHYEEHAGEQTEDDRAALLENQQIIVETLLSFGVEVAAGNITKGPTITRYEIYPSKGLRVNKITSLEKDIARATKAERINILAPIPGRDTIGIEIANNKKIAVALRELLQDDEFLSPKKRIPVALGKDVYGHTVIGDLAAMPHLLVAGATGSGKSVCINSMITSMLYKFKPDELRLILVDPKVVEMQPYRKLPHLIVPVVTDPKKVIGALRWAVNEMERRYRMFAEVGVRNFESFNARPKDEPVEEETEEPEEPDFELADRIACELESQDEDTVPEDEDDGQDELNLDADDELPDKIPYIVIIIDELADLMMVVKEDLENYIARLTQKARAAGIHLIVATQTPRSDVVTGMIKANIPSRIAFQVSSALDSRIILDSSGAEKLVGKGDLLYLPPGSAKLERAQGAFVSDEEVEKIVKHCATQAKQSFHEEVQQSMEGESDDGASGGDSIDAQDAELLQRCIEIVIVERKASTSLLQRRLRIGYGKAARMLELMEQRGIVAPSDGANRPREVLVD